MIVLHRGVCTSAQTGARSEDPHPRRRVNVLDSEMSFVDVGSGAPMVFLHGTMTDVSRRETFLPFLFVLKDSFEQMTAP